jgi:hypothetical protein
MRSASLYIAPRQIDRRDIQWQYERAQKEGSAEAAPGGRKSKVIVLSCNYIIPQFLYKYQMHFKFGLSFL